MAPFIAEAFLPAPHASLILRRGSTSANIVSSPVSMGRRSWGPKMQQEDVSMQRRSFLQVAGLSLAGFSLGSPVMAEDLPPLGSSRRPVVVLGATGKTGKEVVNTLLQKGGYGIRAAVRGEATKEMFGAAEYPADDIDLLTGVDVTKPETLTEALAGAGAVVFASSASQKGGNAEAVDCIGVENVAKACIAAGVERLVVISSLGVTRPDSFAFKFTNLFGNIMDYKEQGEERLREAYKGQTKCSYTIIRPGGLQSGKPKGLNNLVAVQGDTGYSDIDRADVAEVAVASVFYPETAFTTFELYERNAKPLQKEFKDQVYGITGAHTTDLQYNPSTVVTNKESAAAFKEFFSNLKQDSQYDPTNGYKAQKPAKRA
uniref:NAD(P)-binding domain-containing protein n=1 Tax=Hanusia phi TaxID=3032 RepID=A0A7S0HII0_9CRYP